MIIICTLETELKEKYVPLVLNFNDDNVVNTKPIDVSN